MVLTMFSYPEFFQVRKVDPAVHLGEDLVVLTTLGTTVHPDGTPPGIRFSSMFPDVARYCGQYRLGLKPPPKNAPRTKKEKEDEPCDFSPTGGMLTLQILVYMSMANFSDTN
jgi:hypothetical protein